MGKLSLAMLALFAVRVYLVYHIAAPFVGSDIAYMIVGVMALDAIIALLGGVMKAVTK